VSTLHSKQDTTFPFLLTL